MQKIANRGLVLAVDLFQEHVLKQGPQNNESAIEQAKDEYISDCKRSSKAHLQSFVNSIVGFSYPQPVQECHRQGYSYQGQINPIFITTQSLIFSFFKDWGENLSLLSKPSNHTLATF